MHAEPSWTGYVQHGYCEFQLTPTRRSEIDKFKIRAAFSLIFLSHDAFELGELMRLLVVPKITRMLPDIAIKPENF